MRPDKIAPYDDYYLVLARARARELQEAWRTANYARPSGRTSPATRPTIVRRLREAVARGVIGLGRAMFPGDAQLCD